MNEDKIITLVERPRDPPRPLIPEPRNRKERRARQAEIRSFLKEQRRERT